MAKRRVPKDQKSSNEGAWTSFRRWIDTPLPWLEDLQGLAGSDSVFDPAAERVAKDIYRALVPTTPRGIALEVIGGKVGSPVIGAGARRLGRALDVPFDPAKRRTLGTLGGKDTLENMQRRKILHGTERPVSWTAYRAGTEGLQKEAFDRYWVSTGRTLQPQKIGHVVDTQRPLPFLQRQGAVSVEDATQRQLFRQWMKAEELGADTIKTQSNKPGIIGDIAEHMNILARKIGEETAEETGESIAKGADDESLRKVLDNLLRRIGVGRQ